MKATTLNATLVGMLLGAVIVGCTTGKPTQTRRYNVKPFTVMVMPVREINKKWQEMGGQGYVLGFCDSTRRVVYVSYYTRGSELPDLEVLGHEVFHLPELGGGFHD